MKTVKQLLDSKGAGVWSVQPDASVFDALKIMAEKQVGALVVVEGGKPVGILSERDYARKIILHGRTSQSTKVREIMAAPVIFVRPDQTVEECMTLMTDKRFRHLPVLDGERLAGVISIGDLVKAIIDDQQFMIQQLERYITGEKA